MSIDTFAADFTSDLEKYVCSPISEEVLSEWEPKKPAPPERHHTLGTVLGLSSNTIQQALEQQNHAFEIIESMLRIYLTQKSFVGTIDPVKEQVWYFAYKWLETYYELLKSPTILRSVFYKHDHERFLNLLRKMLANQPVNRCTFVQALRIWDPSNPTLKSDDDDAVLHAATDDHAKTTPPVPETRQPASVTASVPSSTARRLVLTRQYDPAGRSKTRRNPRS